MKSKINALLRVLFPLFSWLLIWQITSSIIDNSYFLPDISKTFSALFKIIFTVDFISVVLGTVFRVLSGLVIGIIVGTVLALLSNKFRWVYNFISPLISIIKATPVAAVIIIFWVMVDGDFLAILISFLMVMPIIWQNLITGLKSMSRELQEVCDVFEFSFIKRMRLFVLPSLTKFIVPAIITSVGLAWKSEIAAEIIAYTKNSIGQCINDAKYNFDTSEVFAWTIIVIAFSIILEAVTKKVLERWEAI